MRIDCKAFADFWSANPKRAEEILQRICEAHYGDKGDPSVKFDVRHMHDAVNYTLNGSVKDGDEEFRFTIEDGNWNGTVVEEWGTEETVGLYKPPPPTRYTMVPIVPLESAFAKAKYAAQKKQPWFAELCGKFAYDRMFAPGSKTDTYWKAQAASHGLRFEVIEEKVSQ